MPYLDIDSRLVRRVISIVLFLLTAIITLAVTDLGTVSVLSALGYGLLAVIINRLVYRLAHFQLQDHNKEK